MQVRAGDIRGCNDFYEVALDRLHVLCSSVQTPGLNVVQLQKELERVGTACIMLHDPSFYTFERNFNIRYIDSYCCYLFYDAFMAVLAALPGAVALAKLMGVQM